MSLIPANLNPKRSGATLTKIIEGKYSLESSEISKGSNSKTNQKPSEVQNSQQDPSKNKKSTIQENNLSGKIGSRDLCQVEKYMAKDLPVVHQEPNLDRKIDLPPQPPSTTHYQIQKPSVPNPYNDDSWLATEIEALLKKKSHMTTSPFIFEVNPEAAKSNFSKLAESDFDLEGLLNPNERCATNYGSEFKTPVELEGLLSRHPRWNDLKEKLEKGCEYHLEDLPEDERVQDLQERVRRGNHKSAVKHDSFLSDAMKKEVEKGWALIVPEANALEIPLIEIAPLGVAEHLGISESGTYVPKLRLTHDLSFPGAISAESINSRIDRERMEPIMFGHCLSRVLHQIIALRKKYPSRKIFIRKEDLKSAYRRMHLEAKSAVRSAVRVKINGEWYVLISLRLPFGGSSCPPDFCLMSDIVCDVTNDLLQCENWNESKVHSLLSDFVPPDEELNEDIPLAQAEDIAVPIQAKDKGSFDVFIDDFIGVTVDIGNNKERLKVAPGTVIHAVANITEDDLGVKRDHFIAKDKCQAEGALAERRICLGWNLDTRRLTVELPTHKFIAWSRDVEMLISRKSISHSDLLSLIGKLENVITIVKMMGHFMNNLYSLEEKAFAAKPHAVRITPRAKEDAKLHKKCLEKAHAGISMNLLTFRRPTHLIIGDACEHGLGAFHAESGVGYRYVIPPDLRGRAHINLLEFLTQVIQIWLDAIERRIVKGSCVLGMGDNTSSMGWLRRSNFKETIEGTGELESNEEWAIKQEIARKAAEIILEKEACLYSQWFAGVQNVATDSTSRDGLYLSPEAHIAMLKRYTPKQIPANLVLRPLPNEIVSWIGSLLRRMPVQTQRLVKPKPSELLLGVAGTISSSESAFIKAFSSTDSPHSARISSSQHLLKQCESQPSVDEIRELWYNRPSKPPCHMWLRPSGQATGQTPDWTSMVRLASSSKNSGEDTKIQTGTGRSRKRFRRQSSGKCSRSPRQIGRLL